MSDTLFKHALILSPERDFEPYVADLWVKNGQIEQIGGLIADACPEAQVIDATGRWLLPGFVQVHVHMAQVLFRGLAEGRPLLSWLTERVLPLEAAHDPDTLYASARLGMAELLLGGCTAFLDMGSVRHMDAVYEAAVDMGCRMTAGKIMMDRGDAPPALIQDTDSTLNESMALLERYHNRENGRIQAAFAPRFLLSCSDALMRESLALAAAHAVVWHTHVAEQKAEIAAVREATGMESLELIEDWGGADARLALAHMIHLSKPEWARLLSWPRAGVLHCPRANSKLGSGVARIPEMLNEGVTVGIGSDGSACNNRLDTFEEMRAAAALQDLRLAPGALSPRELLHMATLGGARVLGLDDRIGSVETGKQADLLLLDPGHITLAGMADPATALVHNADARAISLVMVQGDPLVSEGRLLHADQESIARQAIRAIRKLQARAFGG